MMIDTHHPRGLGNYYFSSLIRIIVVHMLWSTFIWMLMLMLMHTETGISFEEKFELFHVALPFCKHRIVNIDRFSLIIIWLH